MYFHTYLIGSSKQFLHVVIFNDAYHQTSRKKEEKKKGFHPPPRVCSECHYHHHTHFVPVPGHYLLFNLSGAAQMGARGLKAFAVTHAAVID